VRGDASHRFVPMLAARWRCCVAWPAP